MVCHCVVCHSAVLLPTSCLLAGPSHTGDTRQLAGRLRHYVTSQYSVRSPHPAFCGGWVTVCPMLPRQ